MLFVRNKQQEQKINIKNWNKKSDRLPVRTKQNKVNTVNIFSIVNFCQTFSSHFPAQKNFKYIYSTAVCTVALFLPFLFYFLI